MMEYKAIRETLLELSRALPENNIASGSTGNISARDEKTGNIIIKSSGVPYRKMELDDFVVLSPTGEVLSVKPGQKSSFETPSHLAIYRTYPNVGGILHTHINEAIVLAASQEEIQCKLTPTGRRLLKKPVPVIPFIENGTEEMAQILLPHLKDNVAVVIRNHGAFVVGDDAEHAFDRTIALRDVCEVYYKMLVLGKPSLI